MPSSFTAPLTVTDIGHGRWLVERAFRYYIGEEDSADYIDVPAGFITDFFSVPIGVRMLLPKTQHGNQASVLHDWLYNQRYVHGRSRKNCDQIFLEAMTVLGVPLWKRRLIYRGVRLGGWLPWKEKEKKQARALITKGE